MVVRRLRLLAFLCVLVASSVVTGVLAAQVIARDTAGSTALDSTPAGRRLRTFIRAYNAGNRDALRDFMRRESDGRYLAAKPDRTDALAAYWLNVFRQFGPVRYHSISRQEGRETEIWTLGTVTHAWLGLDFTVDSSPPHGVTDYAVVRGARPRGLEVRAILGSVRLGPYLQDYLRRNAAGGYFSGAVLVARADTPLFQGAYGFADQRSGRRNTLDTPFYLASVSKMFTAVAVLQLVSRGQLSLDDPLSRYLPDFPRRIADRVTIRRLLTHTSGIELDENEDFNRATQRAGTMAELYDVQLKFLSRSSGIDSFVPPDRFDYSNEDYDLLGVIIERIAGISYDEFLRRNIFEPAAMPHTHAFAPGHPIVGGAIGYTARDTSGAFQWLPHENRAFMQQRTRPSGGHYSTVGDLLRFARALRSGAILDTALTRHMLAPQITIHEAVDASHYYGYGVQIEKQGGVTMIGHGGAFYGASARFDLYPQLGYTVIVLSNEEWVANNVADYIREAIGGFGGRDR